MERKYELTNITKIKIGKRVLYRIKALRDFRDIKKGALGGFIESEGNLSHEGICWVYNDACVYENSRVCERGSAYHNSRAYGNSIICGDGQISDRVCIYGTAQICGYLWVFGKVHLNSGIWNKKIFKNGKVYILSTTLQTISTGLNLYV